ncbi:hypothetical protein R84981_001140 [Carnimonas sp. R-84981]|uniref:LexA family transcriptional regulator n=1 Tax=Carnimonas bestiolae TaxID=3402172 RepID=UPI003EDC26A7
MAIDPLPLPERLAITDAIMQRMRGVVGVDSDYQLAKFLGISTSALSNWRKRGSIPIDQCMSLCVTYGVSLDWLIFGKDETALSGSFTNGLPQSISGSSIPLYDVEGAAGAGRALDHESVIGSFQLDNDTIEQLGINDVHLAGVRVRGDSMEPTLTDNDWVIVDLDQQSYAQGGVFLIWVSGELRIKRLQRLAGGAALLISDNKLYDREMIKFDKMQEFSVLGRVVLRLGEIS